MSDGGVAGALRDIRYAARQLRRAPLLATALLLALAGGTAAAVASLSLAAAVTANPVPGRAPVGLPIPVPALPTAGDAPRSPDAAPTRSIAATATGDLRHPPPRTIRAVLEASVGRIGATLAGVAAVILGLAVATSALLLLSRAYARRREMAMRALLGATPRRLIAQVGIEGAALGLAALLLGLLATVGAIALMRASIPAEVEEWLAHTWSGRALAIGAGMPLLAALGLSALPALFARGAALHARVAGGDRATAGPGAGGMRRALTIAAVGGSYALLCSAILLLRGFAGATGGGPDAFDPHDTLVVHLASAEPAAARAQSYESLLARVAAIPGVRAESLSSQGAWAGLGSADLVHVLTGDPERPGLMRTALQHAVSPTYFQSLGIPLVSGRVFTPVDRAGAEAVVLVNQAFAYQVLPFLDPVGKRLQLGGAGLHDRWYTVVGVVDDPRAMGLGASAEPSPAVYLPLLQAPPPDVSLAVRTSGNPLDTLGAVERAIRQSSPAITIQESGTMVDELLTLRSPLYWFGGVFALLAAFTTMLASLGVYGVVAYQVERRRRELGIRMALGAPGRAVVMMVIREGVRVTGTGLVLGIAGALCLGRLLQFYFPAIRLGDPTAFLAVGLLIGGVAILASALPARAAARLDPALALRAD